MEVSSSRYLGQSCAREGADPDPICRMIRSGAPSPPGAKCTAIRASSSLSHVASVSLLGGVFHDPLAELVGDTLRPGIVRGHRPQRDLMWHEPPIRSRCSSFDADLCFIEPGATAHGTLPWLRQLPFAKCEPARAAARRLHHDAVARSPRGPNQVTHVLFDVTAFEAEVSRDRRDRPWLSGEGLQEILTEGHCTDGSLAAASDFGSGNHRRRIGREIAGRPHLGRMSKAAISRTLRTSRRPSAMTGWFQVFPSIAGNVAVCSCRTGVAFTRAISPSSVSTIK